MDRTDIINSLIEKYNYTSYLEIGIEKCQNFLKVNCKNKECVDSFIFKDDYIGNKDITINYESEYYVYDFIEQNILTYKMDSDTFFNNNIKTYDLIFIDGDHREQQVTKDIYNSLHCLNENGSILLHDSLPEYDEMSLDERVTIGWQGSVYKSILKLNSIYEGLEYYTIDTDSGCCLIRKKENFKVRDSFDIYEDIEYSDVFNKILVRNAALNVISVDEFNNMLNKI